MLKSLDQAKPQDVITRFVGFALILNVPKLIIGSLEEFTIQKSVSKLVLKKSRKEAKSEEGISKNMPFHCLYTMIYWLYKRFFTAFYFYFFPFVIIFIPMIELTYLSFREQSKPKKL